MKAEKGKWYLINKDDSYNAKNKPIYAMCLEAFDTGAYFKLNNIFRTKVYRKKVYGEVEDPRLWTAFKKWWKEEGE